MMNHTLEASLAALEFSRNFLNGILRDFPENQALFTPFAGANHATWILGHITWVDDTVLQSWGGQTSGLPAIWPELFAWKSTPATDARLYPSFSEMKACLEERRHALHKWFGTLDDARLAAHLGGEMDWFARSIGHLPGSIACHENMHAGQLTVVRKALGLSRYVA